MNLVIRYSEGGDPQRLTLGPSTTLREALNALGAAIDKNPGACLDCSRDASTGNLELYVSDAEVVDTYAIAPALLDAAKQHRSEPSDVGVYDVAVISPPNSATELYAAQFERSRTHTTP